MRRAWVSFAVVLLACGCAGTKQSSAPSTTSATPQSTTTTTVAIATYHVKSGDTLIALAQRFGVSMQAVMKKNHLTNPDRLAAGQTLRIPPPPPRTLTVTPAKGQAGDGFELKLTGAQPGEVVRFEIRSPKSTFTGDAHTATADGVVTATYQSGFDSPAGTYTVIVHSRAQDTSAVHFRLTASSLYAP